MKNLSTLLPSTVKAALALGLVLLPLADLRAVTVTTFNDTHATAPGSSPNDGTSHISLRSAIEYANAHSSSSIITIIVPAGTYILNLGELDIGPATSGADVIGIVGAGASTTIIKQSDGINRLFNIDLNSYGQNTTTLSGLTIEGGTDKADNYGGAGILDGSLSATPVDVLTLENCVIQNNHCQALISSGNPGGGVVMVGGNLNISSCTFSNNSSGSSQGGGVFFFPQNVASTLTVTGSLFVQNSIRDVTGGDFTGTGIGGSAIYVGSTAPSLTHSISSSTFISNSVVGTVHLAKTYGAVQVEDSGMNNLLHITTSSFVDNSVTSQSGTTGLGGALAVNSGTVTATYCRFFDNLADGGGTALFSSVVNSASVTAQDNWWGANGGPDTTGAGTITGDGASGSFGSTVNFNPWIVLANTPNPSPVIVGGSTTLTASFLQNSAAGVLTPANVATLIGLPITFNNPILGSLSGAQTMIQSSGTATVMFTAGSTPGTGHADATVDNAKVTANITINGLSGPMVTQNPSDQIVCPGSPATFMAAASGTGVTVQWRVSTDGGATFTDISGANSSTLSFTATSAENGNEYRAHFSNSGGPADSTAATLTVNSPPVAGTDALGVREDQSVNAPVVKLLANDTSPIGGALSIIGVTTPSTVGGTVVLNGAMITYTPPARFLWDTDSFTYTLSDTRCTAQGTVNVTVTSVNAPTANNISVTLTGTGRVVLFAGVCRARRPMSSNGRPVPRVHGQILRTEPSAPAARV